MYIYHDMVTHGKMSGRPACHGPTYDWHSYAYQAVSRVEYIVPFVRHSPSRFVNFVLTACMCAILGLPEAMCIS